MVKKEFECTKLNSLIGRPVSSKVVVYVEAKKGSEF